MMNPYEQHRQNQFHAPLNETQTNLFPGVMLTSWDEINFDLTSDLCTLTSDEARAIVAAIDNNRPHKAALLIKELPWFSSILSGVRATRHLDPVSYIKLSS